MHAQKNLRAYVRVRVPIIGIMATRSRQRKLPADLNKAESLVRSANAANKTVVDVHKQLQSVISQIAQGAGGQITALTQDSLATWLVAK